MGSDVKVMGPANLVKQVKDAIQKMLKQYWVLNLGH
jgi:predicted DNA-binding transcriptional regulator YafY